MSGIFDFRGLTLILTAQCNSHCSYCYQTAKKPRRMDWATIRAAIDLAFNSYSPEIKMVFLGGEPLLEFPKIRRAVEFSCRNAPVEKHVRYAIGTNGLLVTDQIAAFLDEHDFEVQLSFDGIARAQNYRRKGTFVLIDRLLDRLRERHPDLFRNKVRINTVLISSTIPYFADSIRYLMKKGVGRIAVSPSFTPSTGWTDEGIQDLDTQFSRIYDESMRHLEKTGEVPFCLFRKTTADNRRSVADGGMCSVTGGKNLTVDVDGQVYGCVMLAESYQEFPSAFLKMRLAPLRMGNLHDSGFCKRHAAFPEAVRGAEIFHHKQDKYSSYGRCRKCRYLNRCSVCPVSIGYDPGNTDPHRVPDFICAFNMVALKYRDRFPCIRNPLERLDAFLKAFR